jgi:hypothetical protein
VGAGGSTRAGPDPEVVVEPAEPGLGGYVIGRSAEKVLRGLVDSLKKGWAVGGALDISATYATMNCACVLHAVDRGLRVLASGSEYLPAMIGGLRQRLDLAQKQLG